MNALSIISIIIYTSFFIGAGCILVVERKNILNVTGCTVLASLGWWSFCNSFFFAADTAQQAFFWHKLGAIGWCGFVAFTAYYFIALTDFRKKMALWQKILFFIPAVILVCKNVFGETTSLAQSIVMSTNGWGWTYKNSVTSFWLWAFLIYVAVYFGFGVHLLGNWAKTVEHRMKKELAFGFITLDALTIFTGVITDVIFPLTTPAVPAMASIATAIFGIGYYGIIYRYDIFNVNYVISSDVILQTSNNPIFVLDEKKEILKCNNAAGMLIGCDKSELIGDDFTNLLDGNLEIDTLCTSSSLVFAESKIIYRRGEPKDVLISASAAKDKRGSFLCTIVSCQDVSRQKKIQNELNIQRKKYKKLADDYQKLAYFDPLTDLPNRRHFFDLLSEFEQKYHANGTDFAILYMDLDNFKDANDMYGHKFGDELLKAATHRLSACIGDGEYVSRLGGDEFVILMPYTGEVSIGRKLEMVNAEFAKPADIDGRQYDIGISCGTCIFSDIKDSTKLMQKADEAMYKTKKAKKN